MDAKKFKLVGALGILLAILAYYTLPLFNPRYIPTHDGEYHLVRFMEFSNMIQAGHWFPKWAPTINSGYGLPLFEFHYPFPNYVGTWLHWVNISFVDSVKVSSAMGYIVAMIGCYFWVKEKDTSFHALIATIITASVPYWFLNMYVRGSIGEIWALAWVFWALVCIKKDWRIGISVTTAVLILSHNITAMIFLPLLVLYVLSINKNRMMEIALGIGVAAYFWLPALGEKSYMQGLNTVSYTEHFPDLSELLIPSWGTEYSGTYGGNKMSFQIGILPLLLVMIAMFMMVRQKIKRQQIDRNTILVFMIGLGSIYLMTPGSAYIWQVLTPLQLLQYPWRLLMMMIPVSAVLSMYVIKQMKYTWASIVLAVFAVLFVIGYIRPVTYEPRNDEHYTSRPNFMDGTSSMGNSLSTIWTGWKSVRPHAQAELAGGTILSYETKNYLWKQMEVEATMAGILKEHTLYFPGWTASVDGKITEIDYKTDGAIRIPIEVGKHSIAIEYRDTFIRTIGIWISIISLVIITLGSIIRTYKKKDMLCHPEPPAGGEGSHKKT